MSTKQRSATLAALVLLLVIPVGILVAGFARGLPPQPHGAIPDWTPASGAPAH